MSQENLFILSENSIKIWGCKFSAAKGAFSVDVELFQMRK